MIASHAVILVAPCSGATNGALPAMSLVRWADLSADDSDDGVTQEYCSQIASIELLNTIIVRHY